MEVVPYYNQGDYIYNSDSSNDTETILRWTNTPRIRNLKVTKSSQVSDLITNYELQLRLKDQENQILRDQVRGLQKEVQACKSRKASPTKQIAAIITEISEPVVDNDPTSQDIIPIYLSSDNENIEINAEDMIIEENNADIDPTDYNSYYTEITEVDVYDEEHIKVEVSSEMEGSEQYEEVEVQVQTRTEEFPLLENPIMYIEDGSSMSSDAADSGDVLTLSIEPGDSGMVYCTTCKRGLSSNKVLRVRNSSNKRILFISFADSHNRK